MPLTASASLTHHEPVPAPITGAERLPRPFEIPELAFTAIFIPIAVFSWVGILLAELGAFSGWRVLAAGALLSACATVLGVRDVRGSGAAVAPVSRSAWISLAVLVVVSAGMFSRPGEYLIEGADASVYLATGRNIVRTGGITTADPLVAAVPAETRRSFFRQDPLDPSRENRLPGGLRITSDGRVAPSFFHLLPVWIAIATSAAGPYGGYFVNVVLAVLSVMAVWLIGRRVWSPAAGNVAAVLLALNFAQIYYARLASSEVLAQFLLLSAIFFTVLAWDRGSRVAGACAGAAVGLAAFTRIDAMLLLVPLAAAWLLRARREQPFAKVWTVYAGVLGAVSLHAVSHAATIASLYTGQLIADGWSALATLPAQLDGTTALVAAVGAGVAALLIRQRRGHWWVWAGLIVGIVLALLAQTVVVTSSLLLSPVGLASTAAGLALLVARGLDWRVLPVIVPFLAWATLLLTWRETTTLPDDFRRSVPAILPGAMLLIGFLVADLAGGRRWLRRAIWLLPAGLGIWFIVKAAPILITPPARGIHAQVAELAQRIPADALVVTDKSVPGHLASALQYTFGRSALRMDSRPAAFALAPLLDRLLAEGKPVFAAVAPFVEDRPDGLRRSDFAGFDIREESAVRLHYAVLRPVRGAFPREHRDDNLAIALYRVTALDREATRAWPVTLDIGTDDFGYILEGFYGSEAITSGRARWTSDASRLSLPRLATPAPEAPALVLRLSAHRPPGVAPAALRLAIDGLPAGVISQTTSDFREYRVPLSAQVLAQLLAGPTILSIATDTFVPKAAGMNDDPRRLGIALDWVRIEGAPATR